MGEPHSQAAWVEAHPAAAMARSVARWVGAVDAMTLDAPVVDKARTCLLDLIGIAAAGVRERTRNALSRLFDPGRAREVEREIDAVVDCPDAARIARLLGRNA